MINQYETVFIATPVLSEAQMKEAVDKFRKFLKDNDAEIVNEEYWGLKKLAYPILHKSTGFYQMIEFKADATLMSKLEIEYRRDERIIRFLTFKMDKYSIAYSEKRRNQNKQKQENETKENKQEKNVENKEK